MTLHVVDLSAVHHRWTHSVDRVADRIDRNVGFHEGQIRRWCQRYGGKTALESHVTKLHAVDVAGADSQPEFAASVAPTCAYLPALLFTAQSHVGCEFRFADW